MQGFVKARTTDDPTSNSFPKRSIIEGSLRRYYPDGDIDAKIRNDVHFFSNFNFVRAMVRTESRRFADIAVEGNVDGVSLVCRYPKPM